MKTINEILELIEGAQKEHKNNESELRMRDFNELDEIAKKFSSLYAIAKITKMNETTIESQPIADELLKQFEETYKEYNEVLKTKKAFNDLEKEITEEKIKYERILDERDWTEEEFQKNKQLMALKDILFQIKKSNVENVELQIENLKTILRGLK